MVLDTVLSKNLIIRYRRDSKYITQYISISIYKTYNRAKIFKLRVNIKLVKTSRWQPQITQQRLN